MHTLPLKGPYSWFARWVRKVAACETETCLAGFEIVGFARTGDQFVVKHPEGTPPHSCLPFSLPDGVTDEMRVFYEKNNRV